MRYARRCLDRIPTVCLLAYVVFADLALGLGVVPFELYCREIARQTQSEATLLVGLLAANAGLLLFVLSAMAVSGVLLARTANRAALVTLPVLRRRLSRGRSRRSGY